MGILIQVTIKSSHCHSEKAQGPFCKLDFSLLLENNHGISKFLETAGSSKKQIIRDSERSKLICLVLQVYKARLRSTGELVAVKVRFSISSADVGCISSFCTGSDQILQMQKMIRLYERVNVC